MGEGDEDVVNVVQFPAMATIGLQVLTIVSSRVREALSVSLPSSALHQNVSVTPNASIRGRWSRKSSLTISDADLLPQFTLEEVSYHDLPHDCWVVLYDRVYNITTFLKEHPGGEDTMLEYAGRDATLAFRSVGHSKLAEESLKSYLVGILVESERIWGIALNRELSVSL